MSKGKVLNKTRLNRIVFSKDMIIDISLAVICMVMAFLFSYAGKYTTFNTDDFSFKLIVRGIESSQENYLVACTKSLISFYMTWQGTWFANIVMFTLFRLSLRVLHLIVAATIFLFFVFTYICIREVILFLGFDNYKRWSRIVFLLVIVTGINIVTPAENFYWIDGCMVYTIPFVFGLAGTGMFLNGLRNNHIGKIIIGSIICTFACGGSLIFGALFNVIYLSIFVGKSLYDKKINKTLALAFLIVFIGAFINAIAPGNFARQSVDSPDGANIFLVLFYSFEFTVQTFKNFVMSSYLPAICLIIILILSYRSKNSIEAKVNPLCFWALDVFTVFIMHFPYALGYNTDLFVVERVAFVIYVVASIGTIFASIYTGIWMKLHFAPVVERKNIPSYLVTISAFLLINISIVGMGTMQIPMFVSELATGKFKSIYTDSREIEGLIECCEDDDVIIWHHLDHSTIMRGIRLMDYPEYIGNSMIAKYYNKNTVILIETDE